LALHQYLARKYGTTSDITGIGSFDLNVLRWIVFPWICKAEREISNLPETIPTNDRITSRKKKEFDQSIVVVKRVFKII
jgi:hypothetical protein